MALDNYEGEVIAKGWWLYDGSVRQRVEIIARDYDLLAAVIADDAAFGITYPEDAGDDRALITVGPEGLLYYVAQSDVPHQTIDAAKAWADSQPWGPVTWDS